GWPEGVSTRHSRASWTRGERASIMDVARASDPPAATPGNTPEGETLGDRFDLGPEAAGLIPARRAETVAGKARPARKPTQSRRLTCHAHHLASPVILRIAPR